MFVDDQQTPLHLASIVDHFDVAKLLKDGKKNNNYIYIYINIMILIFFVCKAGADLDAVDNTNSSPSDVSKSIKMRLLLRSLSPASILDLPDEVPFLFCFLLKFYK